MARSERRRYDAGDEEFDVAAKGTSGSNRLTLVLIGGGIIVMLLACVVGVGIVAAVALWSRAQQANARAAAARAQIAVAAVPQVQDKPAVAPEAKKAVVQPDPKIVVQPDASAPAHPAKFAGTWKGRWTIKGATFDSVYIFGPDGKFQEKAFDLQGQFKGASAGQWRFKDGKIEINWDGGAIEFGVAAFADANTINYRIVDHTSAGQIGLTSTLRRQ